MLQQKAGWQTLSTLLSHIKHYRMQWQPAACLKFILQEVSLFSTGRTMDVRHFLLIKQWGIIWRKFTSLDFLPNCPPVSLETVAAVSWLSQYCRLNSICPHWIFVKVKKKKNTPHISWKVWLHNAKHVLPCNLNSCFKVEGSHGLCHCHTTNILDG